MSQTEEIQIRDAVPTDSARLASIYNYYIENTFITFEEVLVNQQHMRERVAGVKQRGLPWIVAEVSGEVLGYAYASPWKERAAYRHSVEVSVYIEHGCSVRGLGSRLYSVLFERLDESEVHVALAGIAIPNDRSIALHEKFGMTKVAHLPEVGFKHGRWIDVAYWQKTFS